MRTRVVVIGAGIGGLAAAAELAAAGCEVTVLERAAAIGGKMRRIVVDGRPIDSGPTVVTMKWVFDDLFDAAGAHFDQAVAAEPLRPIARHAWSDSATLDLHSDIEATADAIGAFASAEDRKGYLRFCADTAQMFAVAEEPFLNSERSRPQNFASFEGLATLAKLKALSTMWVALGTYFRDQRLRQLFGRYATYVGASPFETTATMMLIAHVERAGCWSIKGGIYAIAEALAALAERHGAQLRTGCEVAAIETDGSRVSGVRLATGERIGADAVVSNADISALGTGLFGEAATRAIRPVRPGQRTLSGVTLSMLATASGMEPTRHTVFFSDKYRKEFREIFGNKRLPTEPTVYLHAQDRENGPTNGGEERFLAVINAPAQADTRPLTEPEIEQCQTRAFALMERCGLTLTTSPERMVRTTPTQFNQLFPASGGALYGKAMHGWAAAAGRPSARTALPGLYIVGAGAHPGPGVPMVTLSGRKAAQAILSDFPSLQPSHRVAIAGGTSTP